MTSHDPEKAARELLARMSSRDLDGVAELLADDMEFDLAYAPDMLPMPTRGRDAFVDMAANVIGAMFNPLKLEVTTAYPCADGKTVVLEYTSDGTVTHNGNRYQNTYAGIFRVNDAGLIEFWREFHNPEKSTRALGG
ncbi:MAG: nuclear transport factor 2 family protein [Acidimicrobiia bacterium]